MSLLPRQATNWSIGQDGLLRQEPYCDHSNDAVYVFTALKARYGAHVASRAIGFWIAYTKYFYLPRRNFVCLKMGTPLYERSRALQETYVGRFCISKKKHYGSGIYDIMFRSSSEETQHAKLTYYDDHRRQLNDATAACNEFMREWKYQGWISDDYPRFTSEWVEKELFG